MSTRKRIVLPGSPRLEGVVARDGTRFEDFRRSLEPRYGWVWVDVALRYSLMFAGLAGACAVGTGWSIMALATAPLFAVWIGYWFASVVLFMHEGAHYNLHRDKSINDKLANAFICPLLGDEVAGYRALHWQHHLHLGEPGDSEVSYYYPPTLRFGIETLIGVHAIRVFLNHQGGVGQENPKGTRHHRLFSLARGLAVHGTVLALMVLGGWYGGALAWLLAVGFVFPFFSALRQQLEHRSVEARSELDYQQVPHGPVNRMFAPTPFARSFGSAGFRQHLLHHWCPTVSYTNFDELEAFFLQTEFGPQVEEARAGYMEIWKALARPRRAEAA